MTQDFVPLLETSENHLRCSEVDLRNFTVILARDTSLDDVHFIVNLALIALCIGAGASSLCDFNACYDYLGRYAFHSGLL